MAGPDSRDDIFLQRLTQLDEEVTGTTKEVSGVKAEITGINAEISGINASIHSVSLQVSQIFTKLDVWTARQANSQKTNWGVFAAFMAVALSLAFGVVAANVYLDNLRQTATMIKLEAVQERQRLHDTLPSHMEAAVAMARLEGRINVLEALRLQGG